VGIGEKSGNWECAGRGKWEKLGVGNSPRRFFGKGDKKKEAAEEERVNSGKKAKR
jgi:hypothetical protein